MLIALIVDLNAIETYYKIIVSTRIIIHVFDDMLLINIIQPGFMCIAIFLVPMYLLFQGSKLGGLVVHG